LSKIRTVVRKTILSEAVKEAREISLCLVNDKKMKQLNRKYFGKDASTDVIAFNTGDIAVSTDTAVINSKVFKTAPLDELLLYVVHGTLHVLGYEDKTARERVVMENKSAKILKKIERANVDT
jgi:probable rRNA maturation factor